MTEAYIYKVSQDQLEFEDYCKDKLRELGISVNIFRSKKYQFTKGESSEGIEFKFDRKLGSTGNLYIEYAETNKYGQWIDSGILRKDNAWLYVIGNENKLYIFEKKILAYMYYEGKDLSHRDLIHKNINTSKGFLLKAAEAEKWCKTI